MVCRMPPFLAATDYANQIRTPLNIVYCLSEYACAACIGTTVQSSRLCACSRTKARGVAVCHMPHFAKLHLRIYME